jgi:hypothetical protein
VLVGLYPYLLITNLPLLKSQRQSELLWDQIRRPGDDPC